MLRLLPLCLVPLLLAAAPGDEKIFSGPQPGEKLRSFKVETEAGKELTLLADPKDTPRVIVFVHELTRPAMQLMRPVDVYAKKMSAEGLEIHFVWLTADKAKTAQFMERAKKSLQLEGPMSISLDGIEGPGNYGLNRKVAVTILVARGDKVAANFAIVQPNETDAPKVGAAIAKLLGKKAPTLEEMGGKAAKGGKDGPPQELTQLMRRMIQKDADEATVKMIAEEMTKWAGDDAARQRELRAYCQRIVEAGYGTEACKKALAKLAGK